MAIIKRARKKGVSWRVQLRFNADSISKTFDSRREAELYESKLKVELFMDNKQKNLKLSMTFDELVQSYFYFKNDKKFIDNKSNKIKRFRTKYGYIQLKKFTDPILFESYIEEERSLGLKDSTIKNKLSAIYTIFNFALKNNWIYAHPMKNVTRLKDSPARNRRISDEEISSILKHLNYDEKMQLSKKNYSGKIASAIAFLLGLETGMRRGEICGIKYEDIDFKKRLVKLHKTKNGDSREVPLSSKAVALLKKINFEKKEKISNRGDTLLGYPSNSVGRFFCSAKRELGIENLHFHDTRHEAISLLSKKLPLLPLAYMVGHKNLQSMWFYYNPRPEEISELLN